MLGRLFNNRSTENVDSLHHRHHSFSKTSFTSQTLIPLATPDQHHSLPNYANEDLYSRTVLYGTANHLSSIQLEKHNFRLVIVKDKGVLMQKDLYTVLYDTANDHYFDKHSNLKLQNRHSTEELLDFTLANPLYQDFKRNESTKIQVLSSLPDLKNSVLITRQFFIDTKRYAIGVVIPIGLMDFPKGVLSNWNTLMKYLNIIMNSFITNHVLNKVKCTQTLQDSRQDLKHDPYLEVTSIFKQFIKSMNQLNTTPRLLIGLIKFNSVLYNWCFEVNNWIEIKEGAKLGFNTTKFLTSLLTIVNDVKNELVLPDENEDTSDPSTRQFTRIVIMATNPVVAQRLIFIMSGLLKFNIHFEIEEPTTLTEQNETEVEPIKIKNLTIKNDDLLPPKVLGGNPSTPPTPPTPSISSKAGWEIPTTPSRTTAISSIMTPSRSSVIQPTSISNSSSMAYLSSSLSHSQSSTFSSSLSRGFQLLQNWKNSSSNHSASSSVSSVASQFNYKTPSPKSEFEEYPWYSTNNVNSNGSNNNVHHYHHHHLPRTNSCYDLSSSSKYKRQTLPKLPHIDRNISTLFSIGESKKSKIELFKQTKNQCYNLMSSKLNNCGEMEKREPEGKEPYYVLNVPLDDDTIVETHDDLNQDIELDDYLEDHRNYTLPQLSGYVSEYSPEFHIQACPFSNEIESNINSSMKNDLSIYPSSKTILVSLRAREITEVTVTKVPGIDSNTNTYERRSKKLYHKAKPSSSIQKKDFEKIDQLLQMILEKFHDSSDSSDDFKNIGDFLDSL